MPGGGFQNGGIEVPFQMPAPWVERTQAHIVVTINYRLNIFGYPNARGLQEQNLGILDQRLALEWVRDNIAAFGGDSSRIMQWGQSAGSISTDIHTFAYSEDPIASSYFLQSASLKTPDVLGGLISHDPEHSNFTFVAEQLGCHFVDNDEAELDCLRKLPFATIMNFVGQYGDKATQPPITFSPIVDDKIIFSDYRNRTQEGRFARIPVLVGYTANEASSLVPYPANNLTEGPYRPAVTATNLAAWVCPALDIGNARSAFDVPVYRYQYAGQFPNLNPLPWLGAYHSSDIPLIFGTHDLLTEFGNSTELEESVSRAMQDHIVALAADPCEGPGRIGWQPTASNGKIIRFGANGKAVEYVAHVEIEGACIGQGSYNSYP
ncbi:hypothetical protein N0V95_004610 [Ascochyta clinopodiicola]|nr:hypothetical protein N0V95_004610 [Ascochyta clinopodiicola]